MSLISGPRAGRLVAAVLYALWGGVLACHSWKVEHVAPATIVDSLHVTHLRITTRTQGRLEVWRPALRADTLEGLRSDPRTPDTTRSGLVEIPIADIAQVETRHGNTLKTIGLIYLIGAAFAIPAAISVAHANFY